MYKLFNFLMLIIMAISCSHCSSTNDLQKNPPFDLEKVYYEYWTSGVSDGGSGIKLIDKPSSIKITQPMVGSNDRYIWYAHRTSSWQYNARFPQYQISKFDRETGEIKRETSYWYQ